MMKYLVACTAAGLLLSARPAAADVQQWTELGVKVDLPEKLTLSFDQHIRFDEDVSRLGSFMPEAGLQYRPLDWLRLAVGYRLQYERSGSGDMRARHRFFTDARARYDLGEVRLEYRLKLQDQYRPDDPDDTWRQTLRNRADVSYRAWKPWIPGASVELHHDLAQGDAIHLAKIWITAGGSWSKKKRDLELFYRAEIPQAEPMDPTVHILGLAFHHDL